MEFPYDFYSRNNTNNNNNNNNNNTNQGYNYDQFHHHNYLVFNNANAPYIGNFSNETNSYHHHNTHGIAPTGGGAVGYYDNNNIPPQQQINNNSALYYPSSGLEAYVKNDPTGCASGIIPGFTKSEGSQNTRKRISAQQTSILEAGYQQCTKPDKEYREELANKTGLPARTIQIWFQNRRAKAKSQQKNQEAIRAKNQMFPQQQQYPPPANNNTYNHPQYTLNPPPPPHQSHNRRFSSGYINNNPIHVQNQAPGQITSQIIHVPSQHNYHGNYYSSSSSFLPSNQHLQSPVSSTTTPDSLPISAAQASYHHYIPTGSLNDNMAGAIPLQPPPPIISGFGPQHQNSSPTNTDSNYTPTIPSDGELTDNDGPMLTPLSSLQSPSASPYVGSLREKRTPTMDIVPENSYFNTNNVIISTDSTKRRKSNNHVSASNRRSSTVESNNSVIPLSASEASFPSLSTSPCPSPITQQHKQNHHHDPPAQQPVQSRVSTNLRRSVSASGAMYKKSTMMIRQNSSNSTTPYPTTSPVVYEHDQSQLADTQDLYTFDGDSSNSHPTNTATDQSSGTSQFDLDAASLLDDSPKLSLEQMLLLPQHQEDSS